MYRRLRHASFSRQDRVSGRPLITGQGKQQGLLPLSDSVRGSVSTAHSMRMTYTSVLCTTEESIGLPFIVGYVYALVGDFVGIGGLQIVR